MTHRTQWVWEIRLVCETTDSNLTRSQKHLIREVTEVMARLENVNTGMAAWDETGHRIRRVEINNLGQSSPEHQKLMDGELGIEEVVA